MSTINVAQKANEVFNNLEEHGFAGFQVSKAEKESVWHREYAIFVLEFEEPDFEDVDCEYCTAAQFDKYSFGKDLMRYLEVQFPKCKVERHGQYHYEIEIIGPKYKSFAKKHGEAIEELATNHSGHVVFDENA